MPAFEGEVSLVVIIITIILSTIVVCTFVGNLFVIVAILIDKNLQTAANQLVLSLAVADLMVACLVMPLGAYNDIQQGWYLSKGICEFWTSADVLCCTASILNLLAIGFDRYWAVTNVDYIYKRTRQRVNLMILCAWLVGAIVSLAPIFGWKDPDFANRVLVEHKCLVSQDVAYQIFATISTFYAPLVILLALYWRIFQVARKRIRCKPGGKLQTPTQATPTAAVCYNESQAAGASESNLKFCAPCLVSCMLAMRRQLAKARGGRHPEGTCYQRAAVVSCDKFAPTFMERDNAVAASGSSSDGAGCCVGGKNSGEGHRGNGNNDKSGGGNKNNSWNKIIQMPDNGRKPTNDTINQEQPRRWPSSPRQQQVAGSTTKEAPVALNAETWRRQPQRRRRRQQSDKEAPQTKDKSARRRPPGGCARLFSVALNAATLMATAKGKRAAGGPREGGGATVDFTEREGGWPFDDSGDGGSKEQFGSAPIASNDGTVAVEETNGPRAGKQMELTESLEYNNQNNLSIGDARENARQANREKGPQAGALLAHTQRGCSSLVVRPTWRGPLDCSHPGAPLTGRQAALEAPVAGAGRGGPALGRQARPSAQKGSAIGVKNNEPFEGRVQVAREAATAAAPAAPTLTTTNEQSETDELEAQATAERQKAHERETTRQIGRQRNAMLAGAADCQGPQPELEKGRPSQSSWSALKKQQQRLPPQSVSCSGGGGGGGTACDDFCNCCACPNCLPFARGYVTPDSAGAKPTGGSQPSDNSHHSHHNHHRHKATDGRPSNDSMANSMDTKRPSLAPVVDGGRCCAASTTIFQSSREINHRPDQAERVGSVGVCVSAANGHHQRATERETQGLCAASLSEDRDHHKEMCCCCCCYGGGGGSGCSKENTAGGTPHQAGPQDKTSDSFQPRRPLPRSECCNLANLAADRSECRCSRLAGATTLAVGAPNERPTAATTTKKTPTTMPATIRHGPKIKFKTRLESSRETSTTMTALCSSVSLSDASSTFASPSVSPSPSSASACSSSASSPNSSSHSFSSMLAAAAEAQLLASDHLPIGGGHPSGPSTTWSSTLEGQILDVSSLVNCATATAARVASANQVSLTLQEQCQSTAAPTTTAGAVEPESSCAQATASLDGNVVLRPQSPPPQPQPQGPSLATARQQPAPQTSSNTRQQTRALDLRRKFKALGKLVSFVQISRQFNASSSAQTSRSDEDDSTLSGGDNDDDAEEEGEDEEDDFDDDGGRGGGGGKEERRRPHHIETTMTQCSNNSGPQLLSAEKLEIECRDGSGPGEGEHGAASKATGGSGGSLQVVCGGIQKASGPSRAVQVSATSTSGVGGANHKLMGRLSRRENMDIRREKKAAKTLAIITGVFVCCWLPFFLNAIVMPICGPLCTPTDLILSILLWLGYLNSLLNPIIYTIFSPDFRRAFRRLLCFRLGGARRPQAAQTERRRTRRLSCAKAQLA